MKFKDLKAGETYYRDRFEESIDAITYYEKLEVKEVRDNKTVIDRIHCHVLNDGRIQEDETHTMRMNKDEWEWGWAKTSFITQKKCIEE